MHFLLNCTRARLTVAAALLAATVPLAASYRTSFVARHGGKNIAGAEVCFFRAGDTAAPIDRFLQNAADVGCVSADKVLAIPSGRWFYYLRHKQGLISTFPSLLSYRQVAGEPDYYDEQNVEVQTAATVDVSRLQPPLGPDERLAVYVSNESTATLPMIVPVPRGDTNVLVPAGMPVLLLRLRHSRITDVSSPLRLPSKAVHPFAAFPAAPSGRGTLLTWIEVAEAARRPEAFWDDMRAPTVALQVGDRSYAPSIAPRAAFGIDGALMVFENVPTGTGTLAIEGDGWKRDELRVRVAERFHATEDGLSTQPVASLHVRWSAVTSATQPKSCSDDSPTDDAPAANATVRLLICDGLQAGLPQVTVATLPCRLAAEPSRVNPETNEAWFDDLLPGSYLVEAEWPSGSVRRNLALRPSIADQRIDLALDGFHLFGRVKIDGVPVRARLEFSGGTAVSDDAGNYDVQLSEEPADRAVRITRCGDESLVYTHVPPRPLVENAPHDIDIRAVRLNIAVVDAATGKGIAGVQPDVAIVREDETHGAAIEPVPATDARGKAVLLTAPAGERLVACAVAPSYGRACSDVTLGAAESGSVTISLRPQTAYGRIQVRAPVNSGRLYFASPAGVVTEFVRVAPDGSFQSAKPHAAPEYAVFVSADHPLSILELPNADAIAAAPLSLAMPAAPVQNVEIRSDPRGTHRDAVARLIVGSRYVPALALDWHQQVRLTDAVLYGGGPLVIRDVAASGPLVAVLGPAPTELPNLPPASDIFLSPEYERTFIRSAVPADGRVRF